MPERVDCKIDRAGGGVVDGDESWRGDNGFFKFAHGVVVLLCPDEVGILASEVDKRARDGRVVADPYAHGSRGTEERTDVGDCLARLPCADFGYLGVVWDAALVRALVAKNNDFWRRKEELGS